MPMEEIYAKKLPLIANAAPGDWAAMGPFMADDAPYVGREVDIKHVSIPGEVAIPARIYTPAGGADADAPALVWFHGGAFKFGDLDMGESHFVCSELAHLGKMTVITVDYRLCNEVITFPAPQNDAVAAIGWVQANKSQVGIGGKIYAGGASAGACLTGSTVQILRDKGLEQIAGALLLYPIAHAGTWTYSDWQQARLNELPAAIGFPDEWKVANNASVMGKPVSEATGHDFPGEATDLTRLPAHLVINCEYDDLAPSGERYALQLSRAGVPVTQYTEPGVLHGHLNKNPKEVAGARNTLSNMLKFMGV